MYSIAGLNVSIFNGRAMFEDRAKEYRTECATKADIIIDANPVLITRMQAERSYLTLDECAYIYTATEFSLNILDYGGFRLHASAVALDGRAYLFSADSGVGKSTHTSLWCQYFGPERTCILNDDLPLIKWEGDVFYAWGSPWSGTSPLNCNLGVPLKAITFLERSKTDTINRLDNTASLAFLLKSVQGGMTPERKDKLVALIEKLLNTVPIYYLRCTPTIDAVKTSFAAMAG